MEEVRDGGEVAAEAAAGRALGGARRGGGAQLQAGDGGASALVPSWRPKVRLFLDDSLCIS